MSASSEDHTARARARWWLGWCRFRRRELLLFGAARSSGPPHPHRPRAACATLGLLDGSSAGPSTDSLPRRDRVQRGHTKALFAFLTRVPFFFRPLPNLRRNSDASSRGTSPTGRSPSRRAGAILGASTEGRGGSSGASDLSQTLVTDPTRRPGTSSLTAS